MEYKGARTMNLIPEPVLQISKEDPEIVAFISSLLSINRTTSRTNR
jgi:hypothetical protein